MLKSHSLFGESLKKYWIKLCSLKLYVGGKVNKFTVDCSVNAEESLGRENKGDKCLLRFCLPLTTRKKKQQVALKLGHLKPRLYGEIQLTLDNSNSL